MNNPERKYLIRTPLFDCWRSPVRKKSRICGNYSSMILVTIGSIHILEILKAIRESTWPVYVENIIPQKLEIYHIPRHIKINTVLSESKRRLKQWHKQNKSHVDWEYWNEQWYMIRQDILHEPEDRQLSHISKLRLFEYPPNGIEGCKFTLWRAQVRQRNEVLKSINGIKKLNNIDT